MRIHITKLFSVGLALLLYTSCAKQPQETITNAYIVIKDANPTFAKLKYIPLADEALTLEPNQMTSDQAVYSFDLNHPTQLYFLWSSYQHLVIAPGDSLIIDFEKDRPIFSGDGAERQQFIYSYTRLEEDLTRSGKDFYALAQSETKERFLELLESREELMRQKGDSLKMSYGKNDPLLDMWVKQTRLFTKANALYTYILVQNLIEAEEYIQSITSMLPLDQEIIYFPTYANQWVYIAQYVDLIRPMQDEGIFEEIGGRLFAETLTYNRDSNLRQLMLATSLYEDLSSMDTSVYGMYKGQIDQIITLPELSLALAEKYQHAIDQMKVKDDLTADAFVGPYPVDKVIDDILSLNKGKVIYIDIWATWCKPCLYEFKASKDFKEQFDAEEIAYVYVCAQSPKKESWKALVNKYELKGTHLFLSDDQFLTFEKRFPVGYFPSYYIIDQEGNIVNQEANLSPSNPETTHVLRTLLD